MSSKVAESLQQIIMSEDEGTELRSFLLENGARLSTNSEENPRPQGGLIQHFKKKVRLKIALHNNDFLMRAIGFKKPEMVKLLLEAGCSANKTDSDNPYRPAPLSYAVTFLPEVVDLLIDAGANLNSPDQSPLHQAFANGNLSLAEHLINRGVPVRARDYNFSKPYTPPICAAIQAGSLHLVKLCLEKGAEVNWKGPKDGWAHVPMIRALATPYKEDLPEIINLLFSKGFKGNESTTPTTNCLHYSTCDRWLHLVPDFINAGCDVKQADRFGETPLLNLFSETKESDAATIRPLALALVEAGADPASVTREGYSCLGFAVRRGEKDLVDLALEIGCNLNTAGVRKALHNTLYRSSSPDVDFITHLFERGLDLSVDLAKRRGLLKMNDDSTFRESSYCLSQCFGTALLAGKIEVCDVFLKYTGKNLHDIQNSKYAESRLMKLAKSSILHNIFRSPNSETVTSLEYLLRNGCMIGDISPYLNIKNTGQWAYSCTLRKKMKLLLVFGGHLSMPLNPTIATVLEMHEAYPSGSGGNTCEDSWTEEVHSAMQLAIAAGYYSREREPELAKILHSLFYVTWKEHMVTWLTNHTKGPVPLKFRCRQVIRQSCGSGLPQKLRHLDLPRELKEYILLLDILSSSDDSIRALANNMLGGMR